jgi:hypothetical protein
MLCEILRDPSRLDDSRYVAEPKFDGQRAQVHVAGGRTVAAYSRRDSTFFVTRGTRGSMRCLGPSVTPSSTGSSAARRGPTVFSRSSKPVAVGRPDVLSRL